MWEGAFYSTDPTIGTDIDNGEMRTVRSNCRYFKLINTGKALYQSLLQEIGEMRTVRSNCRYFILINTGKALYQSLL